MGRWEKTVALHGSEPCSHKKSFSSGSQTAVIIAMTTHLPLRCRNWLWISCLVTSLAQMVEDSKLTSLISWKYLCSPVFFAFTIKVVHREIFKSKITSKIILKLLQGDESCVMVDNLWNDQLCYIKHNGQCSYGHFCVTFFSPKKKQIITNNCKCTLDSLAFSFNPEQYCHTDIRCNWGNWKEKIQERSFLFPPSFLLWLSASNWVLHPNFGLYIHIHIYITVDLLTYCHPTANATAFAIDNPGYPQLLQDKTE